MRCLTGVLMAARVKPPTRTSTDRRESVDLPAPSQVPANAEAVAKNVRHAGQEAIRETRLLGISTAPTEEPT